MSTLALEWIPGAFAVCRLESTADIPPWALSRAAGFVNITRSDRELSIVVPQDRVPPDAEVEPGWVAIRVVGTLDFAMVGVIAEQTAALAEAGVSVFVISTFETDVLLIKSKDTALAVEARGTVADVSALL